MINYQSFNTIDNQIFFSNYGGENEFNFFHDSNEFNFFHDLNQEENQDSILVPLSENDEDQRFEKSNHIQDQMIGQDFYNMIPKKNEFNIDMGDQGEDFKSLGMVIEEKEEQINEEHIECIQENQKNNKIFDITKVKAKRRNLPKYPRIDDCKIYWRVKTNKHFIEIINESIQQSDLPKQYKKIIHAPSYKKFTQIVKCQFNFNDLQKSMFDILTLNKENEKSPKQNYDNIQNILQHYQKSPTESVKKIIQLISLKYEEVIKMFYDSKEFINFKKDKQVHFFNEEVIRQKGIDLLREYGLISLFKSYFDLPEKNDAMLGRKRKSKH